ncbi:hypothetical protein L1049_003876 [Liquidambar formosana]|uniref:TPR1-like CTLH-containing domain-containing protein n=1 Tax=Liquidambar formosana TaxID=63359 RepID=A0AAP0RRZ9_LIQFO
MISSMVSSQLSWHDRSKAEDILVKDLTVFAKHNEALFNEFSQLLTLENFRHDHSEAIDILVKDLEVLATFNEDLFNEISQLLTSENFSSNGLALTYLSDSGSLKPSNDCKFAYMSPTVWNKLAQGSRKAAVLENVKGDWKKMAIVFLVFLIVIYSFGFCPFKRSNSEDSAYLRGEGCSSCRHQRLSLDGYLVVVVAFKGYFSLVVNPLNDLSLETKLHG